MLQAAERIQSSQLVTHRIKIGWQGVYWIVDMIDCEDLCAGLKRILHGWDITDLTTTDNTEPAMMIVRNGDVYDWKLPASGLTAKKLFGQPESTASALSDIHYLLNGWFVDRFPQYFTLHCAAVRLGDGVVLFPGGHRAGKSLLTVALAAQGQVVFGDDVVAIDPAAGQAMALGMLPRIRLPLPPQAVSQGLRDFLDAHAVLGDVEQQYLDPGSDRLAGVGTLLPVRAIVQLKRTNKPGPAVLDGATNGAALRSLISQNYSTAMPASTVFDHLHDIVSDASCHILAFQTIEDAVAKLEMEFGRRQPSQTGTGR